MLTEQDLSIALKRPIRSPVRLMNVSEMGLRREGLLAELQPYFERLTDDPYLGRQKQLAFLAEALPDSAGALKALYEDYYTGRIDAAGLRGFTDQLDEEQLAQFGRLGRITRQRSIARFAVSLKPTATWQLDRLRDATPFTQGTDDFRAVRRVFAEAAEESVSGPYFRQLLQALAKVVREIHPATTGLRVTVHFMRSLAHGEVPGENSPEGIHEDGAAYIVSALVVQRRNVEGAESQVYEQLADGTRELLLAHTLQPGELLFQADTGEEHTFGNDLWHYVTPAYASDGGAVGVRDILGVDIELA